MKNNIFTSLISALVLLLFLGGCSNMDEMEVSSKGDYSGNPIQIFAKVNGIQETGTATRGVAEYARTFVEPIDKSKDTGLDFETTIREVFPVQTRATQTLANVKFRILAYKSEGISIANFMGQCDFTTDAAGTATPDTGTGLFLPQGKYTFICYSYGKNEVIAPFDGNSTMDIQVNQGEDFMVYQTTAEIVADADGSYMLDNIVFKRKCSSIKLAVTASGFPDSNITACSAAISNLNDPVLNWTVNGTGFPLIGTTGTANITWTTLDAESVTSDATTVFPINERSLSIKFTSLTIGTTTLDNSVINALQGLEAGKYYDITINIARNYIPCGGYKWAKGNVYKENGKFYIEATQDGYHEGLTAGSYFGWNTLEVGDGMCNSGNYNYDNDPCSQIEPMGTWMVPTRVQMDAMYQSGFEWQAEGAGGELAGGWCGIAPNRVFLPAGGWRPNNGVSSGYYEGVNMFGAYSLYDSAPDANQSFFISEDYQDYYSDLPRMYGLLYRCVKK